MGAAVGGCSAPGTTSGTALDVGAGSVDEPHLCSFAPLQWMRARWTSDPCYAFFGVDGTECSFLIYLSEVEWFCPPLPWRNQTAAPSPPPPPRAQVRSMG